MTNLVVMKLTVAEVTPSSAFTARSIFAAQLAQHNPSSFKCLFHRISLPVFVL
jgi:hypothetical protein